LKDSERQDRVKPTSGTRIQVVQLRAGCQLFTGIIEETGQVRSYRAKAPGAVISIEAPGIAASLKLGASIAVNGVCLTVIENNGRCFSCDLSAETLRRSTLDQVREGLAVNLERPLAVGDRLGGHIVQGHVDGIGKLLSAVPGGEGAEMEFAVPPDFERYLILKGSVAVDGISLTVAALKKGTFLVAVIPHTLRETNLHFLKVGDRVNLEADILAKYFERFFQLGLIGDGSQKTKLTVESLKEQGY
jgi:riboflavin synthase